MVGLFTCIFCSTIIWLYTFLVSFILSEDTSTHDKERLNGLEKAIITCQLAAQEGLRHIEISPY